MLQIVGRTRAGAAPKILLLLVFIGLLVGWFKFKDSHGITGIVRGFPTSTAQHIAFVRQDGGRTNLFVVRSDGSDLRQLTDDKSTKRSPSWSPDGSQIVYSAIPENTVEDGQAYQIFLVGADAPRQLTHGSQSKDFPAFRPDGRLIGYLAGGAIKVIEPNGSGLRQVYPAPHKGDDQEHEGEQQPTQEGAPKQPPVISFKWAPGSVALAGIQLTEGQDAAVMGDSGWWKKQDKSREHLDRPGMTMEPESLIMLPNVETEKPVLLPTTNSQKVGFSWYPDGIRLAVTVTTRRNMHAIGLYRADDPLGEPIGLFVSAGYSLAPENPEVSPDGKRLAFEVWRMDSSENRTLLGIAVIPGEGSDMVQIQSAADASKIRMVVSGQARQPKWSPDGKKLLYWMNGKQGRDIWVSNADGSNPVNVTKGVGENADAAWSPAG